MARVGHQLLGDGERLRVVLVALRVAAEVRIESAHQQLHNVTGIQQTAQHAVRCVRNKNIKNKLIYKTKNRSYQLLIVYKIVSLRENGCRA